MWVSALPKAEASPGSRVVPSIPASHLPSPPSLPQLPSSPSSPHLPLPQTKVHSWAPFTFIIRVLVASAHPEGLRVWGKTLFFHLCVPLSLSVLASGRTERGYHRQEELTTDPPSQQATGQLCRVLASPMIRAPSRREAHRTQSSQQRLSLAKGALGVGACVLASEASSSGSGTSTRSCPSDCRGESGPRSAPSGCSLVSAFPASSCLSERGDPSTPWEPDAAAEPGRPVRWPVSLRTLCRACFPRRTRQLLRGFLRLRGSRKNK